MLPTEPSPTPFPPGPPTGTACGKVILLGEHAVVYGHKALAVPVHAVAAWATVLIGQGPFRIRVHFPEEEPREPYTVDLASASEDHPLATAVRVALAHAQGNRTPSLPDWLIELRSTVPAARGMGSSAAVAVALVRAVEQASGLVWDPATTAAMAYEAERRVHGSPSGIDNSVIAWARPIAFAGGQVKPLAVGTPLHLVVADSGEHRATREMVAAVAHRRQAHPSTYADWFSRTDRLVQEGVLALAAGDPRRLGLAMNTNHLILQAMHLSTPVLDHLVAVARHSGALGAKLSGGGGGGVMVAVVTPETTSDVAQALSAAGSRLVIQTTVGTCTA